MQPRVPKRKKGIETRQKILDTAIKMYSENGYYNTNVEDIAKTAGVPVGSIYAYFEDKKDILYTALEQYNQLIMKNMNGVESLLEAEFIDLKELLKALLEKVLKAHEILPDFHHEILSLIKTDRIIKANIEESVQYIEGKVKIFLETHQDMLRIKNPGLTAGLLIRLLEEFVHYLKFDYKENETEQLCEEFVDMFYQYLAKKDA
ncbi:MAG: TetR/AcrR family transcriptional regulator [Spirochaetes bacterium]|nr:TetR/AcrR family transcriptional regulator [Spirochaetota bacterium]